MEKIDNKLSKKEEITEEKNLVENIKVGEINTLEGLVFFGTCHCSGSMEIM